MNLDEARGAFEASIDLTPDQEPGTELSERRPLTREEQAWEDQSGRLEVIEKSGTTGPDFEAHVFYADKRLARVEFKPIAGGSSDPSVSVRLNVIEYQDDRKDHEGLVHFDRLSERISKRLQVRYDSGHVLRRGKVYSLTFRDYLFRNWLWFRFAPGQDGRTYDRSLEKPRTANADDLTKIGKAGSLFCWALNNISSITQEPLTKETLVACDDGSGETCDFLLVDPSGRRLILIHAKGANSVRPTNEISVGPFEQVIAQALKNLRFLDAKLLVAELQSSTRTGSAKLAWDVSGTPVDRKKVHQTLDKLGGRYKREVVVLQPQIAEEAWKNAETDFWSKKGNPNVQRMRQLSLLLNEAQDAAKSVSQASFYVIGTKDKPTRVAKQSRRSI